MFSSNIVLKQYNNKRLDSFLVGMGIVKSRQRAVSLIMSGNVYITDEKIDKPGKLIKNKQIIRIKKNDNPWVSRGGLKLAKAIDNFKIKVKDKVCADLGCSTGGFSDVLLKNGAKKMPTNPNKRLGTIPRYKIRRSMLEKTNTTQGISTIHIK